MTAPTCSIILTTHNNPRALELTLAGFMRQDAFAPDAAARFPLLAGQGYEIIIADDGSREDTRAMVRHLREVFGREVPRVPIVHIWQPHRGVYGKPAIVNKAIVQAQGTYLIMADGDVIPRHDYVRTHLELRRPNGFLAGGDFRLSEAPAKALTIEDVRSGRVFSYAFLRSLGQVATRRRVKLWPRSLLTEAMDAVNISPARWSGSNASCWKDLLLKVNGFDESFKSWGKDDTELGHRLWNAGARSRHVRHNAICLHIWHGEGRFTPEGKKTNLGLLDETIRTQRTRARTGIEERTGEGDVVEGGPRRY